MSESATVCTYVHADGQGSTHRFFDTPVGTPATALVEAAEVGPVAVDDRTIVQGGPGWGIEVETHLEDLHVNGSTNGLIVFDADIVPDHTNGEDRVDIFDAVNWTDSAHETEPRPFRPDTVRLPLITNPVYEGFVRRNVPTVSPGDLGSTGNLVAEPESGGPSIARHASVDDTVTGVTESYVEMESD